MTTVISAERPYTPQWLNNSIQPGPQGSVGDVNMQTRLKQSTPSFPMRWDVKTAQEREKRLGSNVSDGQWTSYDSGGGPARLLDSNWYGHRDSKIAHGWRMQDLRPTDRTVMPETGSTPGYDWANRIATNYESRHTGELFLPLPGPYAIGQGQVPVGGNGPVITNVIQPQGYPTDVPVERGQQYQPDPERYDPALTRMRMADEARGRQTYLNGLGPQTTRRR